MHWAEFLKIVRATSKLKIFLVLVNVVKSNVKPKWANEENQIFLNKNDPTAQEVFTKFNKSIDEVMQAIGF